MVHHSMRRFQRSCCGSGGRRARSLRQLPRLARGAHRRRLRRRRVALRSSSGRCSHRRRRRRHLGRALEIPELRSGGKRQRSGDAHAGERKGQACGSTRRECESARAPRCREPALRRARTRRPAAAGRRGAAPALERVREVVSARRRRPAAVAKRGIRARARGDTSALKCGAITRATRCKDSLRRGGAQSARPGRAPGRGRRRRRRRRNARRGRSARRRIARAAARCAAVIGHSTAGVAAGGCGALEARQAARAPAKGVRASCASAAGGAGGVSCEALRRHTGLGRAPARRAGGGGAAGEAGERGGTSGRAKQRQSGSGARAAAARRARATRQRGRRQQRRRQRHGHRGRCAGQGNEASGGASSCGARLARAPALLPSSALACHTLRSGASVWAGPPAPRLRRARALPPATLLQHR